MKNTKLLSVVTMIFLLLAVGGTATPVVQDEQAQATPVVEATAELTGECFEVNPPCGEQNCRSLGTNYDCRNSTTCCCALKSCQ